MAAGGLVTVQLTRPTLGEGLPLVGRSAGRKLVCGPNASSRRYFLLVSRRPLREVRLKLERFVPTPPGKARTWLEGETMVFDEDLASVQARSRAAERLAAERARARQAGLDRVAAWLRQPDQHDMPALRRHADDYLKVFGGLPPEARRAALRGRWVSVPFGSMSPGARGVISRRERGSRAGVEGQPGNQFDGRHDIPKIQVQAGPTGSPGRPGVRLILRLCQGVGHGMLDLTRPRGLDGPAREPDVVKPPLPPPDDPDQKPPSELVPRISLTGGPGRTIERVLEELHEKTGLPIIGEYDPCFGNRYTTRLLFVGARTASQQRTLEPDFIRDVTIQRALDLIAWQFDLKWKFVDGWIELRSPWTPLADAGEVDLSPPEPDDAP